MNEKLSLQLTLALPGIPDKGDACVTRFVDMLEVQGLEKVHVIQQDAIPVLCLHYDPVRFTLTQVRRMVDAAGALLSMRYQHELMRLDGVDCTTCATVFEHSLQRLHGVLKVSVRYAAERMRFEYGSEKISRISIVQHLETLGYKAVDAEHSDSWHVRYRKLIVSAVAGILLLSGWLESFGQSGNTISITLLATSILIGGYYAMRDAWHSIRERRLDIDVLMVVAAAGAAALGQWAEGALLLVLFSLGTPWNTLAWTARAMPWRR
jgi:Cd2+/Zn2+-exporting ATPase